MKKCASCTKDLPDAALHCVFCGAKQPPAPAVQQNMAKTAFGYAGSVNDVLDQVRQQQSALQGRPQPPAAPAPSGNAPAYNPQFAAPVAPPARPAPSTSPPPLQSPPGPSPGPPGSFVPAVSANAATMYLQNGPQPSPQVPQPPPPGYARPGQPAAMMPTLVPSPPPPLAPPAAQPGPLPQSQPRPQPAPPIPIPASQPPPYIASPNASRSVRPIEPWRQSLRLVMFAWGAALLVAFATPLATSPDLQFTWNLILDGAGTARLPPLTLAAVGLLSILVATIPVQQGPRGFIAALFGLAGIGVPIALAGIPPWQSLSTMIGLLVLVPSLLLRNEYRHSLIARLLVTLGAIGILLPELLPQDGAIPLVTVFKALIDLPGSAKVAPALRLGLITIVVMSFLAWLPAPVTGAAKVWAWLLIFWALITHLTQLALLATSGVGPLVDAITTKPNDALVSWIGGSAAGGGAAGIGSAYLALVGYGVASVLGKQLE